MEEEGMKITVVGVLLIVAAIVGAFWLIRYLRDKGNRGPEPGPEQGPSPGLG